MSDKAREAAAKKLRQLSREDDVETVKIYDKLENGKNKRRFLPRPGQDQFYVEALLHYYSGTGIRCITQSFRGKNGNIPGPDTTCPICRMLLREVARVNKKYERGTEEAKKAWGAAFGTYGPRAQYYVNAFDPENDEPEIKVLRFGPQIMTQLLTEYIDANIEFFSIKRGRTMIINRKSLSKDPRDVKYTVTRSEEKQDLTEMWPDIKPLLHNLETAPGQIMSADEIRELIKSMEINFDEDEDEVAKKPVKKGEDDQPNCFADSKVHDPEDEVCQDCSFFKRCAKAIAAKQTDASDEEVEATAGALNKPGKKKMKVIKDEDDE